MGDDIPACYVIVYQSVHLGDILEGDNPFQKKDGLIFWRKRNQDELTKLRSYGSMESVPTIWLDFFKNG